MFANKILKIKVYPNSKLSKYLQLLEITKMNTLFKLVIKVIFLLSLMAFK